MFDIGAIELLVIAIVAIIVVGPKDLPALLRKIGGFFSYVKKMSADFQSHIRETVEETGMNEVRDTFEKSAHYDWSEEDDRAADMHNDRIMRQDEIGKTEKPKAKPKSRSKGSATGKRTKAPRKKTTKQRKGTSNKRAAS